MDHFRGPARQDQGHIAQSGVEMDWCVAEQDGVPLVMLGMRSGCQGDHEGIHVRMDGMLIESELKTGAVLRLKVLPPPACDASVPPLPELTGAAVALRALVFGGFNGS